MNTQPLISVILPVYNSERYLSEALQSILDQTYQNFELIIVNDGSTDRSETKINQFKDPRIRYFKNKNNLGLSATLNLGLAKVRGKYIARMDSDDISHPDRLKAQVNFLEDNPDYGIVGCMYIILDENRRPYELGGMDYRSDSEIKLALFSNNVFVHGETTFRSDIIKQNRFEYNPKYNPCEDYELWTRMADLTKFHILDQSLYSYMINPNSMSGTRWFEMKRCINKIARELQQKKGLPKITGKDFSSYYRNGKNKQDGFVIYQNWKLDRFHQLNYQEFLFRTGLVYLKNLNIQGIIFLLISFFINPFNWARKFYRLLFVPQPRLKKIAD